MDTQNYKRTVAGSVGAGMGALFNGSGRTYYILEHKNTSKYHRAGESQKIIIDQVELGRDASCQVRFDESFETVSRKHAAIVRDGENWKLVHLSQSNPTLVNGRPISGTYFLQSGDEIQLSVGGPRMGFIVPQGRQALTSSIGLTERMSLFRQQALRPYRTAIWVLACLLLVAIIGFGTWNYMLHQDNVALQKEMIAYRVQLDSLAAQKAALQNEEAALGQELAEAKTSEQKEAIQQRIITVRRQITTVGESMSRAQQQYNTAVNNYAEDRGMSRDQVLASIVPEEADRNAYVEDPYAPDPEIPQQDNTDDPGATPAVDPAPKNGSSDYRDYYNRIYTIKVQRIAIERDGQSWDAGIAVGDIICGTGFLLSNGNFFTARQNVQPWIYTDVYREPWRRILAEYVATGCNILIEYKAYSTAGTAHPLVFTNREFEVDESGDGITQIIEVRKEIRSVLKDKGFKVEFQEKHYGNRISVFSPKSSCWARIRGKGSAGIPFDAGKSQSIDGTQEVHIVGYKGNADIHNLSSDITYFTSHASRADNYHGTIVLQDTKATPGINGSPAFIKENDGSYRVIGIMVGSIGGEDRIVPIANCN